jgi:hypothetical protein
MHATCFFCHTPVTVDINGGLLQSTSHSTLSERLPLVHSSHTSPSISLQRVEYPHHFSGCTGGGVGYTSAPLHCLACSTLPAVR